MSKYIFFLVLISSLIITACENNIPANSEREFLIIGTGAAGFMNGDKNLTQFNHPIRLTKFDEHSILIADIYNHAIRKIDDEGTVTTIIGHPERQGHLDTTLNLAKLDGPHGIAINSKGEIIVGEASNHTLRLLIGDNCQRVAGQFGQTGYIEGTKDSSLFNSPHGIAFNHSDELFIADIGNSVIRKLSENNITSTYLKNGDEPEVPLVYPIDLIVDNEDNLWIVDAGIHKIIKCDTDKNLSIPFPGLVLQTPHGIAQISKDTFAVAEMKANRIIGLDLKNKTTFTLIDSSSFPKNIIPLNQPADVLYHNGKLWIADLKNNRIVVVGI